MRLSHSHDMPLKEDIVDELQAAEVALTALLLLKEERAGFSALPFCLIQDASLHKEASQNYRYAKELFPMKDIHQAIRFRILNMDSPLPSPSSSLSK